MLSKSNSCDRCYECVRLRMKRQLYNTERRKERVICECGIEVVKVYLPLHIKTARHIKKMNKLNNIIND